MDTQLQPKSPHAGGEAAGEEAATGFTTRQWRRISPSGAVFTSIWLIVSIESANEEAKVLVDRTLNIVGSLVDQLSNRAWSDCNTPFPEKRLE